MIRLLKRSEGTSVEGVNVRGQGNNQQRGKDTWRIRYDVPERDGVRKQVSETVKGPKREEQRLLRERLSAIDKGIPIDAGKLTISEYLTTWLRDVVEIRNRPRTVEGYRIIVNRHVIPSIGKIALPKLQATHAQRLEAALLTSGLSANTVHHVHIVLSKAIKDAMRKGLVHRNVCQLVDPPKPGRYEVNAPDSADVSRLLKLAQETPYYAVFHTIAFTGIRRGEAIALKWANVDLDNAIISIVETAQRLKGRGVKSFSPQNRLLDAVESLWTGIQSESFKSTERIKQSIA